VFWYYGVLVLWQAYHNATKPEYHSA